MISSHTLFKKSYPCSATSYHFKRKTDLIVGHDKQSLLPSLKVIIQPNDRVQVPEHGNECDWQDSAATHKWFVGSSSISRVLQSKSVQG